MTKYILTAETGVVVLTPYIMARNAHHFYKMSIDYQVGKETPLANFYLYCISIEIGLKAAILADDCSIQQKRLLKCLRHNLPKVVEKFENIYHLNLFSDRDAQIIESINPHFQSKGLEYFTLDTLESFVDGSKALPDIHLLQQVAEKVQIFTKSHCYFKDIQ